MKKYILFFWHVTLKLALYEDGGEQLPQIKMSPLLLPNYLSVLASAVLIT